MIYSEIIQSKNGLDIPVFTDNRSMHSKYDPLREAQTFGNDIKQDSKFSIIIGLGGAYHIESFVNKNPDHFILVIENNISRMWQDNDLVLLYFAATELKYKIENK